ncbi:CidA/LrgA family protein [Neobacillus cucumis]|uniref:CidA/LrgA family protein n=1 Tax=Neobacillus cucumis TaxID=1740721 RepID=UPI0018DFBAC1|nr:CidA/LrgA family protein [Neobacillus cucumis]MBI0575928.1 CidA/LrgA family protein [Neobacillus cucumis]WHY90121.1 CidA/LrgA family protein [Neobacillus cucumis]
MKKGWKICCQLLTLVLIYQIGNWTVHFTHLKIPGNVMGLMILLVLLWLKIIKIDQIELVSGWLLKHLGFFFIPISVGLMTLGPTLLHKGMVFLFILVISAFIGLVTAGKTTQAVIKKKEKVVDYHDHAI